MKVCFKVICPVRNIRSASPKVAMGAPSAVVSTLDVRRMGVLSCESMLL